MYIASMKRIPLVREKASSIRRKTGGCSKGLIQGELPPTSPGTRSDNLSRANGTYALTTFTAPSQKQFEKELLAFWVSFVRTGDPNTYRLAGSPEWPRWENEKKNFWGKVVSSRPKRIVLKKGETGLSADDYQSASFVEDQPHEELERCRALSILATELRQ